MVCAWHWRDMRLFGLRWGSWSPYNYSTWLRRLLGFCYLFPKLSRKLQCWIGLFNIIRICYNHYTFNFYDYRISNYRSRVTTDDKHLFIVIRCVSKRSTVKTRYNDLSYNDILRLQRYSLGPKRFCKASNDILFITNIVSIYSPKV